MMDRWFVRTMRMSNWLFSWAWKRLCRGKLNAAYLDLRIHFAPAVWNPSYEEEKDRIVAQINVLMNQLSAAQDAAIKQANITPGGSIDVGLHIKERPSGKTN